MIAIAKPNRSPKSVPAWHTQFLAMLPAIILRVRISFRHLRPEAREEAVAECLANTLVAYARLVELGRSALAYPTGLARYAVAQFNDGRRGGGKMNIMHFIEAIHHHGLKPYQVPVLRADRKAWAELEARAFYRKGMHGLRGQDGEGQDCFIAWFEEFTRAHNPKE